MSLGSIATRCHAFGPLNTHSPQKGHFVNRDRLNRFRLDLSQDNSQRVREPSQDRNHSQYPPRDRSRDRSYQRDDRDSRNYRGDHSGNHYNDRDRRSSSRDRQYPPRDRSIERPRWSGNYNSNWSSPNYRQQQQTYFNPNNILRPSE